MTVPNNVRLFITILATAVISPGVAQAAANILLIIGDDMGVETLASYGLGENPPTTAALDELARDGVRFTNVWSQPLCSPTRATIMTGRYGFRTGIGSPQGVVRPPHYLIFSKSQRGPLMRLRRLSTAAWVPASKSLKS